MVKYCVVNTPFGDVLIGGKGEKICFCHFALPTPEAVLQRVAGDFPGEEIVQEREGREYSLQDLLCGRGNIFRWEDLHVEGTPLQVAVWRGMFDLKRGELITYSSLAERCGYPGAVRAVATAVGKNPISLVIPCHRVVRNEAFRQDGSIDRNKLGNYYWGKDLKIKLLEWEGII